MASLHRCLSSIPICVASGLSSIPACKGVESGSFMGTALIKEWFVVIKHGTEYEIKFQVLKNEPHFMKVNLISYVVPGL